MQLWNLIGVFNPGVRWIVITHFTSPNVYGSYDYLQDILLNIHYVDWNAVIVDVSIDSPEFGEVMCEAIFKVSLTMTSGSYACFTRVPCHLTFLAPSHIFLLDQLPNGQHRAVPTLSLVSLWECKGASESNRRQCTFHNRTWCSTMSDKNRVHQSLHDFLITKRFAEHYTTTRYAAQRVALSLSNIAYRFEAAGYV